MVEEIFRKLDIFLGSLKYGNDNLIKIEKYIIKLIRELNLNQILRKDPLCLYNLVKRKFDLYAGEMSYSCLRCKESCCYFNEEEYTSADIPIYKEDIMILKANKIDLKGICTVNKGAFDDLKATTIRHLTDEEIYAWKQELNRAFGYEKTLKLRDIGSDKYPCYYFDIENNKCSIHQFKPIICYTFPYRVMNDSAGAGIGFIETCKALENLPYIQWQYLSLLRKSYHFYNLAITLFLMSKKRMKISESEHIVEDRANLMQVLGKLVKGRGKKAIKKT